MNTFIVTRKSKVEGDPRLQYFSGPGSWSYQFDDARVFTSPESAQNVASEHGGRVEKSSQLVLA